MGRGHGGVRDGERGGEVVSFLAFIAKATLGGICEAAGNSIGEAIGSRIGKRINPEPVDEDEDEPVAKKRAVKRRKR